MSDFRPLCPPPIASKLPHIVFMEIFTSDIRVGSQVSHISLEDSSVKSYLDFLLVYLRMYHGCISQPSTFYLHGLEFIMAA